MADHYREIEAAGGGKPDEQAWLADYLSAFTASVPDYMKSNGLNLESPVAKYAKSRHPQVFRRLLGYQFGRRDEASLNYRSGPPLGYSLAHVRRNTLRWLRARTLRRRFDTPVPDDTYYLYPPYFRRHCRGRESPRGLPWAI